jgi:hypothetical protein
LLHLSARSLAGRHYWTVPWIPLVWPVFLGFRLLVGWREEAYSPWEAQGILIAVPLSVLALLLGVRIIAGEIDKRTLEIAYTVPGGTHRVWLAKFVAAFLILLAAEAWLALAAWVFFTAYPWGALYGAIQAATFYLGVAMGLGALFKSETTAALGTAGVLVLNGIFTGFGSSQIRPSPFWNPAAPVLGGFDDRDILGWTIQNRIGFVLAIAAVVALAISRAERREKLLGG